MAWFAVGANSAPPIASPHELEALSAEGGCGLPACRGVFVVDSSSLVRRTAFGIDLENPWMDFTLGWLDPIGAHADYRNAGVTRLMTIVIERATRSGNPSAE